MVEKIYTNIYSLFNSFGMHKLCFFHSWFRWIQSQFIVYTFIWITMKTATILNLKYFISVFFFDILILWHRVDDGPEILILTDQNYDDVRLSLIWEI